MHIEFCNPHPIENAIVKLIQSYIFQANDEEIKKIYGILKNRYDGKCYPEDSSPYWRPKSDIGLLSTFAIFPEDENIGIDFPSWFNFKEGNKRIMVVGIDPFRKDEVGKDKISIGSPYGIHDTVGDNTEDLYWLFVSGLAKNNSVYVTDTFKVYFKEGTGKKRRSYSCKRFTNPPSEHWQDEIHQKIFAEEIALIKPDLIVTLGKIPVRWFTSCKTENFIVLKQLFEQRNDKLFHNGIPIIPLIHLSGLAIPRAKKLYELDKANDLPGKYVSIVEDYFLSSKAQSDL